jgi:hypothetical protein
VPPLRDQTSSRGGWLCVLMTRGSGAGVVFELERQLHLSVGNAGSFVEWGELMLLFPGEGL